MFSQSLLLLHIAGSTLAPTADAPLISTSTSKSFHAFESCFVSIQENQSRPSWLVPHEDGGRISNEGTDGISNPYRIRFTKSAGRNRIEAFIGRRDAADERPLLAALKSCS